MVDRQGVALGVLGARVVDEAHVLREVHVHVALVELARGEHAVAVELALVIAPLPLEGGRGLAQADDEDAPHVGQSGLLDLEDLLLGGAGLDEGAQLEGGAAQDDLQATVHGSGVAGGLGLGHRNLGDKAVLKVEGHRHVPLAAVGEDVAEQELQEATVEFLGLRGGDDIGEEEVGALELVPEQHVVLRELEVLETQVGARGRAQQVQGGEEPAAAGLLLRRHLPVVHLVGHDRGGGDHLGAVEGDRLDAGVGDGVACDRAGGV